MSPQRITLGAVPLGPGRCSFRVWAPKAQKVELHLVAPDDRVVPMQKGDNGYYTAILDGCSHDSDYLYRLDGKVERPDPASRWQPNGVHAPSRVLRMEFARTEDGWFGMPLRDYVIYELHVGAFSAEGTFDGAIRHLPELKDLGITAIELMPVAQFPGSRNWGYDGVYPFAVQESYGGPAGLKRLVNAAHELGLAVVLDVVYNHLGPEGNYMGDFAPYFTDRYRTPWGSAINFDGPYSNEVRRFFTENALYWQTEFHVDALRLDAVHAIRDFSAVTFLEELAKVCRNQAEALSRRFYLIAESDMNMARHILPSTLGGYGLDAQWSDDFHHCLHVLLTGEQSGYYADFGGVSQFAKVWREGYAYTGQYSRYRRHRVGSSPRQNPAKQFVVCGQNHDQVGNRMLGDRLSALVTFDQQKLAAGAVLLSPFVPLLFMGEEYGETAPFQYFVSHTDQSLIEAVRKGRREEFASFAWPSEVPDPQDVATFQRCKLNRALCGQGRHQTLREFYGELLRLRKELPAIANAEKQNLETTASEPESLLMIRQWSEGDEVILIFNFSAQVRAVDMPFPEGKWGLRLNSSDRRWAGSDSSAPAVLSSSSRADFELPARSLVLYQKQQPD